MKKKRKATRERERRAQPIPNGEGGETKNGKTQRKGGKLSSSSSKTLDSQKGRGPILRKISPERGEEQGCPNYPKEALGGNVRGPRPK